MTLRVLAAGAVVGMMMMTAGCTTLETGRTETRVQVIAHRGASADAPENTLAAFRLAHQMRADWFELDCTLSRDGEVIVIHDGTVDRTTNGTGAVRDLALAQLKALDAGSWKDPRFASETLPTLGESLDLAREQGIGVYVEIKSSDDDGALMARILDTARDRTTLTPELWREVMAHIEADGSRNLDLTRKCIAAIRERDMGRQAVIQSFSPVVCAVALAEAPELRVEYLGSDDPERPEQWEQFLRWGYLLDVHGFNVHYASLNLGRLAAFHRAGKTVAVWTVDDEADMRRLAGWGVDAIITNRPDLCLQVLDDLRRPAVTPLATVSLADPLAQAEP